MDGKEELRQRAAEAVLNATESGEIHWEATAEGGGELLTAKRWGMTYTLTLTGQRLLAITRETNPRGESILKLEQPTEDMLVQGAKRTAFAQTQRQREAVRLLSGTTLEGEEPVNEMRRVAKALADATSEGRLTWERTGRLPYMSTQVGEAEFRLFTARNEDIAVVGMTDVGPVGQINNSPESPCDPLVELAKLTGAYNPVEQGEDGEDAPPKDLEADLLETVIRIEGRHGGA